MNILQHKSWHVRNKDNIERVRRDEENARKEEEERLKRVALAESEARTSLLRDRAQGKSRNDSQVYESVAAESCAPRTHINFFAEEEQGIKQGGVNEDREREKREETEKREKAVGLLKYLGQDSLETQAVKPWYYAGTARQPHEEQKAKTDECDLKKKSSLDPMHMMRKYVNAQRKLDGRPPEKSLPVPPAKRFRPDPAPEAAVVEVKNEAKVRTRDYSTSSSSSSGSSSSSDSDEDTSKKKKHKHKRKKSKKDKHRKHSTEKKHKKKKKKSHKKKSKKQKKEKQDRAPEGAGQLPSSATTKSMAQLRAERLQREQAERQRTQELFAKLRGEKTAEEKALEKVMDDRSRGYNSQFNPELAKKPKKKKDNDAFELR